VNRIAALVLLLCASPVAAQAQDDLPAAMPGIVAACLDDTLTRDERRAAFKASGLRLLDPADRATAQAELTPANLVEPFVLSSGTPLSDAAIAADPIDLAGFIKYDVDRMEIFATYDDVYAAADPSLRLFVRTTDIEPPGYKGCHIALPPGDWTAAIGAILGAPSEDPFGLNWVSFDVFDAPPATVWLTSFSPAAFGGTPTLPQLTLTPPLTF
jgi:hypothetical protein